MKGPGKKRSFVVFWWMLVLAWSVSGVSLATPLTDAVSERDLEEIKRLVAEGVDVNEVEPEDSVDRYAGLAPLHVAASEGLVDISAYLLKQGADVHVRASDWGMPHHLAAYYGELDTLKLLADHGADLNALSSEDRDGSTALQYALADFQIDVAEWLVDQEVRLDDQTLAENGISEDHPLIMASQWLDYDDTREAASQLIERMLEQGMEVGFAVEEGYGFQRLFERADDDLAKKVVKRLSGQDELDAALLSALEFGLVGAAEVALAGGANAGAVLENGYMAGATALQLAIDNLENSDNKDEVWALIWRLDEEGALWDVEGHDGSTAQSMLFRVADEKTLENFIASREIAKTVDDYGNSPLSLLIKGGKFRAALAYVSKYPERPLTRNLAGFNELHSAYRAGMTGLAAELIAGGADVSARDPFGQTVLHSAYMQGDLEFIRQLNLSHSALNAGDRQGNTLLHLAVNRNDADFARQWVALGADPNVLNEQQQSPLSQFIALNRDDFSFLLRHARKDPSYQDGSLLHLAAKYNNPSVIEQLLEDGFDPGLKNSVGYSPVQVAISHGSDDALELLVSRIDPPQSEPGDYLFDNPMLEYWAALLFADHKQEMLTSVEQHIAGASDTPLASFIWAKTNISYLGRDLAEVGREAQRFGRKLEVVQDVVAMEHELRYTAMLAKYPATYPFNINDLFAIIRLAFAAEKMGDVTAHYDYLNVALRLAPDFWQLVWMYDNNHDLNNDQIRQQALALAASPELTGSLAQDFLNERLRYRRWTTNDRLQSAKKWLTVSSNDPRALTSAALSLGSLHYFGQSKDHGLRGMVSFPFYSNRDQAVKSLVRIGEFEQAKDIAWLIANLYEAPDESAGARAARYYGESLRLTGDHGRARSVLTAAIEEWPNDERLLREMARLERSDGRHQRALELFEQSINGRLPAHERPYLEYLDELLSLGRSQQAASYAERLLTDGRVVDVSGWSKALSAMMKVVNPERFELFLNDARHRFPKSADIREVEARWLAGQQPEKAIAVAEQLLAEWPGKYVGLWKTLAAEHLSEDQYDWRLAALRAKTPWVLDWYYLGGDATDEHSRQSWRQAMTEPELLPRACKKLVWSLTNDGQFQQALADLESCEQKAQSTEAFAPSQQLYLYESFLYLVEQWSYRERLAPGLLEEYFQALETYQQRDGNQVSYYRHLEYGFRLTNDVPRAAEAARAWAKIAPDNSRLSVIMVTYYSSELGRRFVWGYIKNLLDRRPFDEDMVSAYLNRQLLYGGSAVNALRAIESAKANGVAVNPIWANRAYSRLGDPLKGFESYSKGLTTPSASKFYIDWFESFRNSALTADPKQIRYDFSEGNSEVEIIYPNGEVVTRQDHAVLSRPIAFTKGAARITIDYDDEGRWTGIQRPDGEALRLVYDENGQVVKLIDVDKTVTQFVYSEDGKVILIDVSGVGSVSVEYGAGGSIKRVHSEQGQQVAFQITQTFQQMMSQARMVGKVDDLDAVSEILDVKDERFVALKEDLAAAAYPSAEWNAAYQRLATHLVNNVTSNANYFDEAADLLTGFFQQNQRDLSDATIAVTVNTVELWHQLYRTMRPYGLDQQDFSTWSDMRNWLAGVSFIHQQYQTVLDELEQAPLKVLASAKWVQKSELANSAFWERHGNQALVSKRLGPVTKQAILMRNNGDVVLGTNKGLSILKDGFWQWYGLDYGRQSLDSDMGYENIGAESSVLSMAETDDGALWLGTARGVVSLADGYGGQLKFWNSEVPTGSSDHVSQLAAVEDRVIVGTSAGIYVINSTTGDVQGLLLGQKSISQLQVINGFDEPLVLVNSNTGAYLIGLESHRQLLVAKRAEQVSYLDHSGELLWRVDGQFRLANVGREEDGMFAVSDPQLVARDNDILMSRSINQLTSWWVPGVGEHFAVNSDLGINILRKGYFESIPLPFEASRGGLSVGPEFSHRADNGDIALYTADGVYLFTPSKVRQYPVGRVYDLLSHPDTGKTYIATGREVAAFDPNDAQSTDLKFVSGARARVMKLAADGSIITHNGMQIVRVNLERGSSEPLFSARQSTDEEQWQGEINDIHLDDSGVVWVAAGSSLFRYQPDTESLEEYNYLIDSERFPSKSQDIFRVYRDLDEKLQVVASPTLHFEQDGVQLSGGLLELRGDRFVNLADEQSLSTSEWFATGYTAISDHSAIVGTNGDYQLERNGRRESFPAMNDASYNELKDKNPMLWLGGQGASLGDGTWLFPSAGGVVVYHRGRWFYPDKLNQLLPEDQQLGQYGGRTVHTISVDSSGHVLVGTDLGLLVYESQGPESLLTDHGKGSLVFMEHDQAVQQQVTNLLLPGLADADTNTGELVAEYRAVNENLIRLEAEIPQMDGTVDPPRAAIDPKGADKELTPSLQTSRAEHARQERRRELILANLERDNRVVHQMLAARPGSVADLSNQLGTDEVIVQYLPTASKLLIQVVTDEGAQIREVAVAQARLDREIRALVKHLDPSQGRGGSFRIMPFDRDRLSAMDEEIFGQLSFLYETLLRPIERDIEDKELVYLVPAGSLNYVPFPALVSSQAPEPQYAVEKFTMGILPTSLHHGLLKGYRQYLVDRDDIALLIADPLPGDSLLALPGSRKEVLGISELPLTVQNERLRKVILQGDQASLSAFGNQNDEARIIHIAAPVELRADAPDRSYLALADARLSMVEISALDLEKTDLVVMSASRSNQPGQGLEFNVMLKSFAVANVPTVVATKWQVDEDITRGFMEYFYRALAKNEDNSFRAIAEAQRAMLSDQQTAHPAFWSSFMVYGRP